MLGSAPVEPCSQPIFSFGLRSIAPGPDTSFAVLHRALFDHSIVAPESPAQPEPVLVGQPEPYIFYLALGFFISVFRFSSEAADCSGLAPGFYPECPRRSSATLQTAAFTARIPP